MYTTKQLVKISQRILDTLVNIRLHRYQELLRRLTNSRCQLEEIIETGHGFKLATDRHWLAAAELRRVTPISGDGLWWTRGRTKCVLKGRIG